MFVCFNFALSFFSPLLFSAITLVDPACTALVSWALEIEGLPDLLTWVGGLTVIGGIALVLYGESSRTKRHQRQQLEERGVGSIADARRVGPGPGVVGVEGTGSSPRTELESPSSDGRAKESLSPVSVMLSPRRGLRAIVCGGDTAAARLQWRQLVEGTRCWGAVGAHARRGTA